MEIPQEIIESYRNGQREIPVSADVFQQYGDYLQGRTLTRYCSGKEEPQSPTKKTLLYKDAFVTTPKV